MDLAVSEVQLEGRRLFTGIVRDITERKRGEEQLKVIASELSGRNADLVRSNQELDAFAYIASHDLKEPLRGIHNYATFLVEDYSDILDDDGKDKLNTLTRLTQRLDSLLDSLLEFSRLGRVDFALAQNEMQEVVHEVIESMRITLDANNIDIRIPVELPRVRGDKVMLGEVYRNLITNAVKYNSSESKWIEIGFQPDTRPLKSGATPARPRQTVFYVRDNGLGIPEKHFDAIFRIFKRLHERDAYGGGTGVGLTIVKKVVERHGGEIWLESTPGQGTTFYFTLAEGD
ncbi:MAG: cyanobacterial phytochrome [Planctomycetaceae bacterium]|nr:cyanobacterial phytochrome [Planctomycetaceae bacterium]